MTHEVKSLDYSVLKIPYEVFNKRFRSSQKEIDKLNHRYNCIHQAVDARLPKNNDAIPAETIRHYVPTLIDRLKDVNKNLRQAVNGEIVVAEDLEARLHYFQQVEETTSMVEQCAHKNQRIDRMIVEHLHRIGCFETAAKLAEASRLGPVCNDLIFGEAKRVEQTLRERNLKPCLEWIFDNRSKLRRLQSDFDMEVRMQECIEMIRDDRQLEAVKYARRYFSPLDKDQWTKPSIQNLMGLLGSGKHTKIKQYQRLYSDVRWAFLANKFKHEFARVFQLSHQTAFSTCLQTGIAALKTPCCLKSIDRNCRCSVCHPDVFDLADGLPIRHSTQSRLICTHSGDKIDEDNIPMMLPNGYVYGQRSIQKLTNEKNEVTCPRTHDTFQKLDVLRVFVL